MSDDERPAILDNAIVFSGMFGGAIGMGAGRWIIATLANLPSLERIGAL